MKKQTTILTACIILVSFVLAGFSIWKDNQVETAQDGTITLRMAQTSF